MKALNAFAIVIGIFLLIEGIWGFFNPVVFGVLSTNSTHATIHVVLGLLAIFLGMRRAARGFCIFLGLLLLAVGILRFVPGPDELTVRFFNVNYAVAWLNIVVGAISLLLALVAGRTPSRA
ncbi:MAG: DUF4383 domain-containing protein [Chthoniobacterales bacterium]